MTVLSVVAVACQSSPQGDQAPSPSGGATTPHRSESEARLTITPARTTPRRSTPRTGSPSRSRGARSRTSPRRPTGRPSKGRRTADGTSWHSRWALLTDTRYSVRATAVDAEGRSVSRRSSFTHARALQHVLDDDLRGRREDLRRGDADHPHVQRSHHGQARGGALAGGQDLRAGRGRVVLGRRPEAVLPPARLLAGEHDGWVRRSPRRRRRGTGTLRGPHADAALRDRALPDRGCRHAHAPPGGLPGREAVRRLADQHGQAGRRHARTAPTSPWTRPTPRR